MRSFPSYVLRSVPSMRIILPWAQSVHIHKPGARCDLILNPHPLQSACDGALHTDSPCVLSALHSIRQTHGARGLRIHKRLRKHRRTKRTRLMRVVRLSTIAANKVPMKRKIFFKLPVTRPAKRLLRWGRTYLGRLRRMPKTDQKADSDAAAACSTHVPLAGNCAPPGSQAAPVVARHEQF